MLCNKLMNSFTDVFAFIFNLLRTCRATLTMAFEAFQATSPLQCFQPSFTQHQPLIHWYPHEICKANPFLPQDLPTKLDLI